MPIAKDNLEPALNMLNAIAQRQQTVQQLTAQLHSGVFWRSPDGALAVPITDAQRTDVEAFIKAYLDECDILTATLRATLAPSAEGGLS